MKLKDLKIGETFSISLWGKSYKGFVDRQSVDRTKVFIYGKGIMFINSAREI